MKNILDYRKPIFWVAIATLLICVVVLVCFLTSLNDYSYLPSYEQSEQKLSELSEAQCLEFIASRGIKIPDDYNSPIIGEVVKRMIADAEKYPQSMGMYGSTYAHNLSEAIRKAVNEYYGIAGTKYVFIEEPESYKH